MKIGTTGTRTPFLPESELPDCGRLTSSSDDITKKEEKELRKAIDESKKLTQNNGKYYVLIFNKNYCEM